MIIDSIYSKLSFVILVHLLFLSNHIQFFESSNIQITSQMPTIWNFEQLRTIQRNQFLHVVHVGDMATNERKNPEIMKQVNAKLDELFNWLFPFCSADFEQKFQEELIEISKQRSGLILNFMILFVLSLYWSNIFASNAMF
jgi:hypothetical protein